MPAGQRVGAGQRGGKQQSHRQLAARAGGAWVGGRGPRTTGCSQRGSYVRAPRPPRLPASPSSVTAPPEGGGTPSQHLHHQARAAVWSPRDFIICHRNSPVPQLIVFGRWTSTAPSEGTSLSNSESRRECWTKTITFSNNVCFDWKPCCLVPCQAE